jgi:hypothetical protein
MLKQTSLRHVRIYLDDGAQDASFVFPFFDTLFQVQFLLIGVNQGHFVLHEQPLRKRRALIVSKARLAPLGQAQLDLFRRYFHFDPWWTMRDATGVAPAVRQAVIASNVAGRRYHHLLIRDVVFSDHLDRVEKLRIGDGVFRTVSYNQLIFMPWLMQEAFFGKKDLGRPISG